MSGGKNGSVLDGTKRRRAKFKKGKKPNFKPVMQGLKEKMKAKWLKKP